MRFLKHPKIPLGRLESSFMDLLWSHGELTVREILNRMKRPLAYTTVMTTVDRLHKKGLLRRRKQDRAYFYSPSLSRSEWTQMRTGDLVAELLATQNSPDQVMSCLVDAVIDCDKTLLDELERKIDERRRELKGVSE